MRNTILLVLGVLVVMAGVRSGVCMAEDGKYSAVCNRPVPDTWLQEQRRLAEQEAKAKGFSAWPDPIDCRPRSCEADLTEKIRVVCWGCSMAIYECSSSTGNGGSLLTCRDVVWPGNPHSGMVLTEEEFLDTGTRCTKVCGACGTGWR
ncbi:MAG TPA: hypothetical protein VFG19_11275 [Geobacteraceae bacterium]|nr:hypothetical protein [Geobacteraceae bacterium]